MQYLRLDGIAVPYHRFSDLPTFEPTYRDWVMVDQMHNLVLSASLLAFPEKQRGWTLNRARGAWGSSLSSWGLSWPTAMVAFDSVCKCWCWTSGQTAIKDSWSSIYPLISMGFYDWMLLKRIIWLWSLTFPGKCSYCTHGNKSARRLETLLFPYQVAAKNEQH